MTELCVICRFGPIDPVDGAVSIRIDPVGGRLHACGRMYLSRRRAAARVVFRRTPIADDARAETWLAGLTPPQRDELAGLLAECADPRFAANIYDPEACHGVAGDWLEEHGGCRSWLDRTLECAFVREPSWGIVDATLAAGCVVHADPPKGKPGGGTHPRRAGILRYAGPITGAYRHGRSHAARLPLLQAACACERHAGIGGDVDAAVIVECRSGLSAFTLYEFLLCNIAELDARTPPGGRPNLGRFP